MDSLDSGSAGITVIRPSGSTAAEESAQPFGDPALRTSQVASPFGEMLPGLTLCYPLLSQAVTEPGSERSQLGAAETGQLVGVGAEPHQPCQQEVDGSLEAFIQGISKPAAAAILMTPAKKTKATRSQIRYTLSVKWQNLTDATRWALTGFYGPQQEADKIVFLDELNALQHGVQREWLVASDFNLIYKAKDKISLWLWNPKQRKNWQLVLVESKTKKELAACRIP
jgi:hypothetical protein